MIVETRSINLSEVVFDEAIYPRKSHDPGRVNQYLADLPEIEARGNFISVSANMKLLDGRHRHLAYLKSQNGSDREITVFYYPITDEREEFALAVELNATHGQQLSTEDKRSNALRLYSYGYTLDEIARRTAVRKQTVNEWTKNVREEDERRRTQQMFDMWLACYTDEEIADCFGVTNQAMTRKKGDFSNFSSLGTKVGKLANFELERNENGEEQPDENGWKRPLYNVWTFARKTNAVSHFGNSEQRIVENLLYLYTQPFDIVVDPFGGGGSTIDVCKKRLRRYWVSDRLPIVEREREIRQLDIGQELPPLHKRWSEVTLTYLDPPYWRQAEGQYSHDAEDLANMPLDQFTETLTDVVHRIADKQSRGVIALLIQPTQWKSDNREFTDHVMHLVSGVRRKKLVLENRISCPYSTEQANAQQVEWAKANHKLLVISRELIVWRLI